MPKPGEEKKLTEEEKLAEKAKTKKPVKLETRKKMKQVYACHKCKNVWALSKGNLCPKCGTPGLETWIS